MKSIISNISISNKGKYKSLQYKSATLYYIRLELPNTYINNANGASSKYGEVAGTITLYKLGYTTTSLTERIFGKPASYYWGMVNGKRKKLRATGHIGMGLPKGTLVYEIATYSHHNASYIYQIEQYLHNKYSEQRWSGQPVLANGNTELYNIDILGLDN